MKVLAAVGLASLVGVFLLHQHQNERYGFLIKEPFMLFFSMTSKVVFTTPGVLAPPFYPLYPVKEALSTPSSTNPFSSHNGLHFPILPNKFFHFTWNCPQKSWFWSVLPFNNDNCQFTCGNKQKFSVTYAASMKVIAKYLYLLDAWDYEAKNWQVNSCFAASILSRETPLYLHFII